MRSSKKALIFIGMSLFAGSQAFAAHSMKVTATQFCHAYADICNQDYGCPNNFVFQSKHYNATQVSCDPANEWCKYNFSLSFRNNLSRCECLTGYGSPIACYSY